ncbi:hypothetical protein Barb6_02636 [Bacteroidales bacterium Barb6]|nr:hypothetical protein Barb6_02636 [Bacteroidales bacterium Barb6]
MKLYHGSTCPIECPVTAKGRASTDFGQGFYTTTHLEQAKKWALSKVGTDKGAQAFVTTTVARLRVNDYFNQVSFHSEAAIKELRLIKTNKYP